MTARSLDGNAVAEQIMADLAERAARLRAAGRPPGLGTILVGDNPSSSRYVEMKREDCAKVGIESVHAHLPADVSQQDLESVIARFNEDERVDAFLVQLPLPGELDEEAAINVKNEALRNLKERLLTRAEIIQRRLEEEQKNLENAYVRSDRVYKE